MFYPAGRTFVSCFARRVRVPEGGNRGFPISLRKESKICVVAQRLPKAVANGPYHQLIAYEPRQAFESAIWDVLVGLPHRLLIRRRILLLKFPARHFAEVQTEVALS